MHPQTNPTYIFIKLKPEKDNYNVPIILHTNVKQLPSPLNLTIGFSFRNVKTNSLPPVCGITRISVSEFATVLITW